MESSTAQRVLLDVEEPGPTTPAVAPLPSGADVADGLPPPTKAQVYYWAQLCGELSLRGTAGIAGADGWPADLVPSSITLKALQERGLLARRDRAWKLRRGWYERLSALKLRAVNTPPLRLAERPAPNLPTYAELEAWEAVCRWLDAQPGRRARLPFVGLALLLTEIQGHQAALREEAAPAGSLAAEHLLLGALIAVQRAHEVAERAEGEHVALLKEMRRYRLVRHTADCAWALSPKWRETLQDLHAGIKRALREYAPLPPLAPARSLCAGLDTWALNWMVEEKALPARLRRELDDYQESAHTREGEVETAWVYDGVPLRMYQAGVRPKGGKGVSWSYILVNPSLRLLIRRTPLGGIVANARLGSECLWRRTPRAALDEVHTLVRRLWGREKGRWQVSYAHLAHDVANAPLERDQLDRYVSRSRRQAVYDAAKGEMARLLREARPRDAAGAALDHLDNLEWDALPIEDTLYDWEAEFGEDEEVLLADAFIEEGSMCDPLSGMSQAAKQAKAELESDAEQRAITTYRWGKRLSGVAFSPGGAVSFVMYRKDWEGRLKGKRHMEPVWKAAGWDGKESVTRHEARLVREPIRELCAAGAGGGGSSDERALLDDPWRFLEEAPGIWARMVGRVDACPEAVDVAWLRRVVPREGESNRSRWDTDSVWRVVQAAPFAPAPLASRRLIRRTQQRHDVRMVDRGLLGLFKRREALLHADPRGRDLSLAMRDAVAGLERELAARGESFDEAVRRKRQDCGLPVPLSDRMLPLPPRQTTEEAEALRALSEGLERDLDLMGHEGEDGKEQEAGRGVALQSGDGSGLRMSAMGPGARVVSYASLRTRSAELRMREAYAALEAAEFTCAAPTELERVEHAFLHAVAAYDAARSLSSHVGASALPLAWG